MTNSKETEKFLQRAMAICAGSEKCRADIEAKLIQWGLDAGERIKIIEQLVREKFIDEERYAVAFARDKFRQNKWGRIKISAMLRMKGLGEDVIRKGLDALEENLYAETLKKLIASQKKQVRAVNNYELRGKLIRFAVSKGFETDLVYDAVNELINDNSD
ncbi:MAG TPA: regulatory protein RecX [Bacteroidales bacterium]|nr:regulatory protein RecX [Bacteroidales bacterium]